MKYSKEFKIKTVLLWKKEKRYIIPQGIKRKSWYNKIRKWERIYDQLGEKGLEHNNLQLSFDDKLQCINRLLNGESAISIAISYGKQETSIIKWYKIYRQYGIDGLKSLKRGREKKMKKPSNDKNKSELKKLREENKYLKAENEYLKKLRALIQKEKKDQPLDKK